jgi:hypothetical protein
LEAGLSAGVTAVWRSAQERIEVRSFRLSSFLIPGLNRSRRQTRDSYPRIKLVIKGT